MVNAVLLYQVEASLNVREGAEENPCALGSNFNPNQPFALGITYLGLNLPRASGLLLI